MKPLRLYPDPALRIPARPLTEDELGPRPDPEIPNRHLDPTDLKRRRLHAFAAELEDTMRLYDGVGIAAPQLGVGLRLAVIAPPDERAYVIANPVIVDEPTSLDEDEPGTEGCLSLPGLECQVRRPAWLSIEARRIDGTPLELDVTGYEARIASHELDHLDGTVICDHLSPGPGRDAFRRRLRCQLLGHPNDALCELFRARLEQGVARWA